MSSRNSCRAETILIFEAEASNKWLVQCRPDDNRANARRIVRTRDYFGDFNIRLRYFGNKNLILLSHLTGPDLILDHLPGFAVGFILDHQIWGVVYEQIRK